MGAHINAEGEFQSDKYPSCPAGKVPLSTKDPAAQDLLAIYAQRRRAGSHGSREVDIEFSADLESVLISKGFDVKEFAAREAARQTILRIVLEKVTETNLAFHPDDYDRLREAVCVALGR